jgi:Ser/Thr protein kinase RdoA (MazF antagonist)
MQNSKLKNIVASFGLQARTIEKPPYGALTEVYVVNGTHILRARETKQNTIRHLEEEQKMLKVVFDETGIELPILMETKFGENFVQDETLLWTMYPFIIGTVKRTWYHLDETDDNEVIEIFGKMSELHAKTRGKLDLSKTPNHFSDSIEERFNVVSGDISSNEKERVERALKNVKKIESSLPIKEMVYVHGDYHPGNIIMNEKSKIVGLIDTDWSRFGHYLEDLSYTIMMFLRNYKEDFVFEEKKLNKFLNAYDFNKNDRDKLNDYLILYTLYDVFVFQTMINITNHEKYLKYQKSMLKELCLKL